MSRAPPSRPRTTDTDFLARSGVTSYVKDVISMLLDLRPDDPIEFVAEYFQNVTRGVPAVTRAYRQVLARHHDDPRFTENVAAAYTQLEIPRAGLDCKGVMGAEVTQLLGMLCSDFSPHASDVLLQTFSHHDGQVVTFGDFFVAVKTCDMYRCFLARAEVLFKSLDKRGTGLVDKQLCDLLLHQLMTAAAPSPPETSSAAQPGAAVSDFLIC